MWSIFKWINKHLIIAIPAMMAAGFGFGLVYPAGFLKGLIIPFTFLMVYPMMVNLKIKKVFEGGDMGTQILTQAINFGVIPFAAFGLGIVFFSPHPDWPLGLGRFLDRREPYMALGLLLAGLVPTSGMTISWTGFARGNIAAAVKMTVVGLTIGSIATPFYVKSLLGAEIEVNMIAVMRQIVIIVFIPMLAGFLTQRALVKRYGMKTFSESWAPRFPALSTAGVVGIVFIAMALKARAIAAEPRMLLYILIPLTVIYAFNYGLSTLVGRLFLPRGDAIALVYGSVMRNLSIALAIAINAFGPEGSSAALVIAIAYIIQVQSAAWYVNFTDRVYGPPEAPAPEPAAEPRAPSPAPPETPACDEGPPEFRHILYATDLSDTARHAINYACGIGSRYDGKVTVLHVVPDVLEEYSSEAGLDMGERLGKKVEEYNDKSIQLAVRAVRERIEETTRRIRDKLPRCPLHTADLLVKVGNPVQRIVDEAEAGPYDLVVMGTHGRGKLEEMVVGNVAMGVIQKCSKPVMVVRLPS
jgi:arsenite transporter